MPAEGFGKARSLHKARYQNIEARVDFGFYGVLADSESFSHRSHVAPHHGDIKIVDGA